MSAKAHKKESRLKKRIEELESMVAIQSQNGNWNYDSYMFGLANGLILAHYTMTHKPTSGPNRNVPPYLSRPKVWLKDRKVKGLTALSKPKETKATTRGKT